MTDTLGRLRAALGDRYTIERELGRGGYAIVYLADDLKHGRKVAIKVLLPELASAMGPDRFLREIEIAAKLSHPHILPLHDSGEADGFLYYVMPYVEGESLRGWLDREEQLPLEGSLRIAREVGSALGYAHERGVLHRDIKPENILLQAGHAVVADFGIARAIDVAGGDKVTKTGIAVGTPGYMSPEQATGQSEIDARSDIYSLACVLYEMLAGKPPFTGRTAREVIASHMLEPAPSVSEVRKVPAEVETTVAKALEKSSEDRFCSAGEFLVALTTGAALRRRGFPRRVRQFAVGLVAVVALVVAGAVAGKLMLRPENGEAAATRSIAVLPLTNLAGDPEWDAFAAGLTDLLASELSRVRALNVKSYTSAMRYQTEPPPMPEIGRELRVEYLIEGTVTAAADEVRINIQLIEAAADRHEWTEDYRRPLDDLLKTQGEVARAIASQVQARLDPLTRSVAAEALAEGVDPAAADAYRKGRLYVSLHRIGQGGPEAQETAISYLGQAITLEPDWARPYAEMARLCVTSCEADSTIAYARAALERDPNQPQAYMALAVVAMRRLDWAGADSAYDRAIALDPNTDLAEYGVYLWATGRYGEAAAMFSRDLELQPFTPHIHVFRAFSYLCGGEHERAIEYMEDYLEADPGRWAVAAHEVLSGAYLRRGDYERALLSMERAVESAQGRAGSRSRLGYVHAKMGHTEKAREILEELEEELNEMEPYEVPVFGLAMLYSALGRSEAAVPLLEDRFELNPRNMVYLPCMFWLGVDLTSEPNLRDNPRFQDLLSRIPFPE